MGVAHHHGLGSGGGLVEQGGIGNIHAGQVGDHGLVVEQRLEPALGNLWLVRGVLGVPSRVLHDVPQNHGGGEGAIVPHADVGAEDLVLLRDSLEHLEQLRLGQRGILHDDSVDDEGFG